MFTEDKLDYSHPLNPLCPVNFTYRLVNYVSFFILEVREPLFLSTNDKWTIKKRRQKFPVTLRKFIILYTTTNMLYFLLFWPSSFIIVIHSCKTNYCCVSVHLSVSR